MENKGSSAKIENMEYMEELDPARDERFLIQIRTLMKIHIQKHGESSQVRKGAIV